MAEYLSTPSENQFGQKIEFREYLAEGHSPAERRAAVAVSGTIVRKGWVSDGKTYELYRRWVAGTVTAEDGACIFHNRPGPAHDFYYGDECRRCGVKKEGTA